MQKFGTLFVSLALLSACNAAYTPQTLPSSMSEKAAETKPAEYQVELKPIDAQNIVAANATRWDRKIVEVATSEPSGSRVVSASSLDRGQNLPKTEKPAYTLGAGDVLSLSIENRGPSNQSLATKTFVVPVLSDGTVFVGEIGLFVAAGRSLAEFRSMVFERLASESKTFAQRSHRTLPPANVRPSYRIGAGDRLILTAILPEMTYTGVVLEALTTRQFVVSSSGSIYLIGAGEVQVEGLSTEEALKAVSVSLVRSGLSPDIELAVIENNSNPVQVIFDRGTTLPIIENLVTLSELATLNGLQYNDDYDYGIRLERRGKTYEILLSEMRGGAAGGPIYLHPGDVIEILPITVTPEFSLDVVEYNSQSVTIGSTSGGWMSLPIRQEGLTLSDALAAMNVQVSSDFEFVVSVYRQSSIYRMRASEVLKSGLQTDYYFEDKDRIALEQVAYQPDRIYLAGAGTSPQILEIKQLDRTSLTDAVYGSGAFSDQNADLKQVFVLREDASVPSSFDAYFLDLSNPMRLALASDFQMRPDDIVFVSDQSSQEFAQTVGKINQGLNSGLTGLGLITQILSLFN